MLFKLIGQTQLLWDHVFVLPPACLSFYFRTKTSWSYLPSFSPVSPPHHPKLTEATSELHVPDFIFYWGCSTIYSTTGKILTVHDLSIEPHFTGSDPSVASVMEWKVSVAPPVSITHSSWGRWEADDSSVLISCPVPQILFLSGPVRGDEH